MALRSHGSRSSLGRHSQIQLAGEEVPLVVDVDSEEKTVGRSIQQGGSSCSTSRATAVVPVRSCQNADEAKQVVPSLKPVPPELNIVRATNRLGITALVPSAVVHLVATLAGFVPFSIGYCLGKIWSLGGFSMADCQSFKAGCFSFIYANGIMPTVLCHHEDGCFGPLPGSESEQREMLRSTPMVVSNHVSYIDVMVLPLVLQMPKFMSKVGIKSMPLFGRVGTDLEYIWVERGSKDSRSAAMQAIATHVETWQHGDRPLLMFPEGTTSNGRGLLDFKQGAFFTGAPVRPVLLKYTGTWDPANVDFLAILNEQDGRRQNYSESEWAMNFLGHLVHSCTVLICEPYIPSRQEQADTVLYAENVKKFMLQRLRELELICKSPSFSNASRIVKSWRRRQKIQQTSEGLSLVSRERLKKRLQQRERRLADTSADKQKSSS